jgi:hypothetical protein
MTAILALSMCICVLVSLVVVCCRTAHARRRAVALLHELLTDAELDQIAKCNYLEVPSPSIADRIYRIPGAGGRVRVFDRGEAVVDLCVQPARSLPRGDVILLHKLLIETGEEAYLRTANHFPPELVTPFCVPLYPW